MKKVTRRRRKEPSRDSTFEVPKVGFKRAKVRRHPYARGISAEGISIHVGRGRLKNDQRLVRSNDGGPLLNLRGFGPVLVALRIARGLSQRDLAERLGIHQSQVSRDERNDYHSATVARAIRVLEALKVEMTSSLKTADVQRLD